MSETAENLQEAGMEAVPAQGEAAALEAQGQEPLQEEPIAEDPLQEEQSAEEMEGALEAILFACGKAVDLEVLARGIGQEKETTRTLLHDMMQSYAQNRRGISLREYSGKGIGEARYQLCTKAVYYPQLIRVTSEPRRHVLTEVVLETLSIIAYKQPVTKQEIERIRGVKSDHAVNRLVEYGLVEEMGRLNAPGRPVLFGTTEEFLRQFGLDSLEGLPGPAPGRMEELAVEAGLEAGRDAMDTKVENVDV